MNQDLKKFFAEMIGTFVLVLGGCGSAIFAGKYIGFAGVSAAFGLSLLVMAFAIGNISGCHVNPAVSLGMMIAKKISPKEFGYYAAAQVIGGIAAGAVLYWIASGAPGFNVAKGFAANGFGAYSPAKFGMVSAIVAEVVLTALLMFTVMGTTHSRFPAGMAGIPVGLVLMLIHLISIPITNTSVNPARSIGVAVFQGGWAIRQLWLFIAAPLAGAVLGVFGYKLVGEKK